MIDKRFKVVASVNEPGVDRQAGGYTSGHIKTVSAKQGVSHPPSSLATSSLTTPLKTPSTRSWVLGLGRLVFAFGFGFSGKETNGAEEHNLTVH